MFQRAVCLNLDKRLAEQDRLAREFGEAGLYLEFFVAGDGSIPNIVYNHIDMPAPSGRHGYPAWVNRPNSYNAFLCFKKIIREAQADDIESVALVEDDCTLLPNFKEVLNEVNQELKDVPPWDMLYLCANHTWTPTTQVAPHLLKLNGSGGFQFVIIRHKLFQVFLDMPLDAPIDAKAGALHSKYNCYAVWPNIAIPLAGYSYCEGTSYDNTKLYKNKGC